MAEESCNMRRGKICFVFFVLSIFFFVSSLCTFAVMAVTKDPNPTINNIEIIDNSSPQIEQTRIIKRLKRIEERMKKRKNRNRR